MYQYICLCIYIATGVSFLFQTAARLVLTWLGYRYLYLYLYINIMIYIYNISLSIYLSMFLCACIHIYVCIPPRTSRSLLSLLCANPDPRGPGKPQFACAAVCFVGRLPLRVKIFHSFLFRLLHFWAGRDSNIYICIYIYRSRSRSISIYLYQYVCLCIHIAPWHRVPSLFRLLHF